MNVKEWAEKLNGRERRKEITAQEERQTKEEGIVIVYGASDDLMEFGGAIHDEVSANNGGVAYVTASGLVEDEDRDTVCSLCEHMKKAISTASAIKAVWEPKGIDASWLIEAPEGMPHEHFDIMEDGQLYCRGLVFRLADAKPKPSDDELLKTYAEQGGRADRIAVLEAQRDELLALMAIPVEEYDNADHVEGMSFEWVDQFRAAIAKARGR